MSTELIAVPEQPQRPRRAYKPRLSLQKIAYQSVLLKRHGLSGEEFHADEDLVEQLAAALVEARKKKRYIREIIRGVARLFSK